MMPKFKKRISKKDQIRDIKRGFINPDKRKRRERKTSRERNDEMKKVEVKVSVDVLLTAFVGFMVVATGCNENTACERIAELCECVQRDVNRQLIENRRNARGIHGS
jgi:hypothetical protein